MAGDPNFRWDTRGPCDGPRDCVGTDRGCVVCSPDPTFPLVGNAESDNAPVRSDGTESNRTLWPTPTD